MHDAMTQAIYEAIERGVKRHWASSDGQVQLIDEVVHEVAAVFLEQVHALEEQLDAMIQTQTGAATCPTCQGTGRV